jgi:cytoskeleton protein RodZ
LIVVAALAVYLLPSDWVANLQGVVSGQSSAPPVELVSVSAPTQAPAVPDVAAVVDPSPVDLAVAASSPALAASDADDRQVAVDGGSAVNAVPATAEPSSTAVAVGPLQVRAAQLSWVEVVDSRSQVLVSRMLQPGETVVLDGAMPFKLKLGNAAATEVAFRGQAVDLAASTRDNVARLELK